MPSALKKKGGSGITQAVKRSHVGDTLNALKSLVRLPAEKKPPCWLTEHEWEAEDCIPFENGILHVPSFLAGKDYWIGPTPAFFNTHILGFAYDPNCPGADALEAVSRGVVGRSSLPRPVPRVGRILHDPRHVPAKVPHDAGRATRRQGHHQLGAGADGRRQLRQPHLSFHPWQERLGAAARPAACHLPRRQGRAEEHPVRVLRDAEGDCRRRRLAHRRQVRAQS